jgi:hypothetical protein
MQQLSLFPELIPPSSSLAGLELRWPRPCRCGAQTVLLGSSTRVQEAGVICGGCGTFRGWLSRRDANVLRAKVGQLGGRPGTPITIL